MDRISPNTKTTTKEALIDLVYRMNNGDKVFKYKFQSNASAYDFSYMLERMDKIIFDFEINENYITSKIVQRITNNN